jgi:hypothetical protein
MPDCERGVWIAIASSMRNVCQRKKRRKEGPMERQRACICPPRHDGYVRLEEKPGEAPVFAFTAIDPSVARDRAATALCDSPKNVTAPHCVLGRPSKHPLCDTLTLSSLALNKIRSTYDIKRRRSDFLSSTALT